MESAFEAPTAELLLDTRTPAELALSPDGSRLAFALHATVADVGSLRPERSLRGGYRIRRRPGAAHRRGVAPTCSPAWSPDGSRLAFLSDRITPGHQLPYTMPAGGGEPTLAATLTGSAESVAWSSDGGRLLVLAADPGSYGLDWGARAVKGAEPESDPVVRRPGDARRRLFLIDLGLGRRRRRSVRPTSASGRWTGTAIDTVVAIVVDAITPAPAGTRGWSRGST